MRVPACEVDGVYGNRDDAVGQQHAGILGISNAATTKTSTAALIYIFESGAHKRAFRTNSEGHAITLWVGPRSTSGFRMRGHGVAQARDVSHMSQC